MMLNLWLESFIIYCYVSETWLWFEGPCRKIEILFSNRYGNQCQILFAVCQEDRAVPSQCARSEVNGIHSLSYQVNQDLVKDIQDMAPGLRRAPG